MEIKIDEKLQSTLDRLAGERSIAAEVYVEGYVRSHLFSQLKQDIISKITAKNLDDTVTMNAAVTVADEAIKAATPLQPFVEPMKPE